jgi:hypothetical protein
VGALRVSVERLPHSWSRAVDSVCGCGLPDGIVRGLPKQRKGLTRKSGDKIRVGQA